MPANRFMIYIAQYAKAEKRYFVNNLSNGRDYYAAKAMIDSAREEASLISYLGRVHHVATLAGPSKYYGAGNARLSYEGGNSDRILNTVNQGIFANAIAFTEDASAPYLYGSMNLLTMTPDFGMRMDERYHFDPTLSVRLDDRVMYRLSQLSPEETVNEKILPFLQGEGEDVEIPRGGYYRLAVIASFDVYLSASFKKLADHRYELRSSSYFLFCPIEDSFRSFVQYSEDGDFSVTSEKRMHLKPFDLYEMAESISW